VSQLAAVRRWRPGLASLVALVVVVVAVAAVCLYDHKRLQAWTPNIAVTAASIAITVTVLSSIVRQEERKRIRPRVDRTQRLVGEALRGFIDVLVIDYAGTHVADFKALPDDVPAMVALWLSEHETATSITRDGDLPLRVSQAAKLAASLQECRAHDLDVLEPDLVRSIDDFCSGTTRAFQDCALADTDLCKDPERVRRQAVHLLVQKAQPLVSAAHRHKALLPIRQGLPRAHGRARQRTGSGERVTTGCCAAFRWSASGARCPRRSNCPRGAA
jgi:hypothetical protein